MSKPWEGAPAERALREQDFERAAAALGCDVAAIKAVWEVEAAGRHFLDDGSVIRRFEPHHFPRGHWGAIGFSVRDGEAPWRASVRLSSEAMFRRAADINPEAAMRASSWGAPQIMGFNHKDAGFGSAEAMVEHMATGAAYQLGAFVQLIEGWGIAGALRGHDWRAFARRYNGSGQVDRYARLMEAAYRRHSGGARSPVVLRVGARGAAVKRLQEALGIETDGAFGPQTLAAVQEFQREAGLTVDGVVGAKTWAALERHAQAYGDDVKAPAQDSVGDHIERETGRWLGLFGAVGAALTALSDALRDLPEPVLWALIAAAGIGGVMWWRKRAGATE